MMFWLHCVFIMLLVCSCFAVIAFLPLQEKGQENTGVTQGERHQHRNGLEHLNDRTVILYS
jgi:hypothetical protein